MKRQVAKRNDRTRTRVIPWLIIAVFSAALLAACGGDDGNTGISGSAVTPTPVLDDAGEPLAEQPDHQQTLMLSAGDVRAAAYSPDGSQIALSSGSTIWIVTAELEQVRELKGHAEPVRALAWSPDGSRIASAALDDTARIWDAESGTLLTTLSGHTNWVMDVAWSPDGSRLVTAGTDHTLRLWDAESGEELGDLGTSRVDSILITFSDDEVFDAIADMNYAETVLNAVNSEPLSDLVAQTSDQEHSVAIAFTDPVEVDRLLQLNGSNYRAQISTDDASLTEQIDALSASDQITLVLMLDDEQIAAMLSDYSDAEAVVAAINARDDADMIRTVQGLKNQEVVLVIERADGETTTANPAEENFIATIADLEGDDVTITFGIENEADIAAALQDPDFVAAVQQYDAAQETLAALTTRDDASLLLMVRQLGASDYTIALVNGDEALDADLSTLDNDATIWLITLLNNADLLATLERLADVEFVVSDLDSYSISELSGVLAPLDHTVVITTGDDALNATLADTPPEDVAKLADLINSVVLRYAIDHAEEAQATLDEIAARDDYALITTLRKLENPRTIETIISAPPGSDEARVSLKHNKADYVLALALSDEDMITTLSALHNEEIVAQFTAEAAATLTEQVDAGSIAPAPALTTDEIAVLVDHLASDMLTVSVQREANAHLDSVMSVAWSAPGDIVASTSADLSVRLWQPTSGKLLNSFELDEIEITLAWSPDGMLLAAGGWTNSVILWDVREGAEAAEEFEELTGAEERILDVAWSSDGSMIAAGTADGALIIWNIASGDELNSFAAHDGETRAVTWSVDGSTILSAGTDDAVRLWPVEVVSGE